MNARNLYFIKKFNDRKSVLLADNKIKTKEFLSSRGIPVGTNYAIIPSKKALDQFSFEQIFEDDFVIKPNRGCEGKGIHIVRRVSDEASGKYLYSVNGGLHTEDDLKYLLRDILDGRYSLSGSHDTILIEEKLIPGKEFSLFCKYGLADIRIIVFGLVPVIAMVRVPTEKSGGRANLARGGIALGVDIATGRVEKLLIGRKVYTKNFPSQYKHFTHAVLPFWDTILAYSAQIQFYSQLGYVGLDWVITEDGPKLLEINARAGLEVQNANLMPLKSRLEQIEKLKISTPEKGVEIAQTLFRHDQTFFVSHTNVLSLEEDVFFLNPKGGKIEARMRLDLTRDESSLSPDLALLSDDRQYSCFLVQRGKPFSFYAQEDITLPSATIVLGRASIDGYYIDPKKPDTIRTEERETRLQGLDRRIHALAKAVNLSRLLKPENYTAELATFLAKDGKYDPIFTYKFPEKEALTEVDEHVEEIRDELIQLGISAGMPKLLYEKTEEILVKSDLVRACIDQNEEKIRSAYMRLYGKIEPFLLQHAHDRIAESGDTFPRRDTPFLPTEGVVEYVKKYLAEHAMADIAVRVEKGNARMSVRYSGNIPRIAISPLAQILPGEVESILAHEVGIHLRRYQEGSRLGWSILKYGTAFYLADEEGLAVYNSLLVLPEGEEKLGMYKKYIICQRAQTTSFRDLIEIIRGYYPEKNLEQLFTDAVRAKRGIMNTRKVLAGCMKDIVYLNGFTKVKKWMDSGGEIDRLLIGKIKIEDLKEF